MSYPLENHVTQFLLSVSKEAVVRNEDSFFLPCIPSFSYSLEDLKNEQRMIDLLKINQIPKANPVFWPCEFQGKIEDKIKEFYQNCQYEGVEDNLKSSEMQQQVSNRIHQFDQNIDELLQKISNIYQEFDKAGENNDNFDLYRQEINKYQNLFKIQKTEKMKYIDSNLHFAVKHYNLIFENFKNQSINNISSNQVLQNIVVDDPSQLIFKKFNYISQDQQLIGFDEESQESKISNSLKGFGLGKKSQNQLQNSIEQVFEKLNIECEYSYLNFKRNWLPLDLLQFGNIGLKNKQKYEWSNGRKNDQESSAQFPYFVVGAVICKNISIRGFKAGRPTQRLIAKIQSEPDDSFGLIFQLQDSKNNQSQSLRISDDCIEIKSYRILGLILQPLKQFPKIIYQSQKVISEIIEGLTEDITNYIDSKLSDNVILQCFQENPEISNIPNYQNLIQTKIEAIKLSRKQSIPGLADELPKIESFHFKQKLKEDLYPQIKVNLRFPDPATLALYGIKRKELEIYVNYFSQYKCITNREENVFKEERELCELLYQEKCELNQISEQTLIHPQILKFILGIQDKIEIQNIDKSIIDQKNLIIEYIDQKLDKEVIVACFDSEDYREITSISNWQEQMKCFINEILQENNVPEFLPKFENFQQKQMLIKNFKNLKKDFRLNQNEFSSMYNGLQQQDARKCFNYFEKNQNLTNKIEDVMKEEREIFFELFLQAYGNQINLEQISKDFLINEQVLLILQEEYSQQQIKIPDQIQKEKDYIQEMIDSDMESEKIIDHFHQVNDEIINIKNWEIYIKIMIAELKQEINKSSDQRTQFDQQSQVIVSNIKLPKLTFEQKQLIKKKLKANEIKVNRVIPQELLQQNYLNMTNEQVQAYKAFYDNVINNFKITIRQEDLMEEEKNECIEYFNSENNINFKQLSDQTLIHEDLLKDLQNSVYFDQEILQILQSFTQLTEQILKDMLSQKSQQIINVLIDIFKQKTSEYLKIQKICYQKQILKFLMDNQIENFYKSMNDEQNLKKIINYLEENDLILLVKLIKSLENEVQIQDNDQNDQDLLRINEQFTQLIHTNNQENFLAVFVKATKFQELKDIQMQLKFEKFEKNLCDNYNQEQLQILKDSIQNLQNNISKETINKKISELLRNNYKQIDQNDIDLLQKYFFQEEEILILRQNYDNNIGIFNENEQQIDNKCIDIEKLSKIVQKPISLHQKNNVNDYKIFGLEFIDNQDLNKSINIAIDQDQNFYILNVVNQNLLNFQINVQKLKQESGIIYNNLKPWLKRFLEFKSLGSFLYDSQNKSINYENIKILQNLVSEYENYIDKQDENSYQNLSNICLQIQNQYIFSEWYEQIIKSEIGTKFSQKFEIYWARNNSTRKKKMQEKNKQQFPNPERTLDLRDFNKLRGRKEKDQLKIDLEKSKDDPHLFLTEIFQQMFGYIIRRENISQLVDQIQELELNDQISTRFLVSLVLQKSNIELRSRLIYYLSEYYSVPLIMNCQSSYVNGLSNLLYMPEIAFEMLEGMGILNFGAGKSCQLICGKTQLLNDLLFPSGDFQHNAFEQNDKNIFSSGQIDVFFEKSFDVKRKMVIMDGQGCLSDKSIKSVLNLTNIVIINFNIKEINDTEALFDLYNKIQIIKNVDSNIHIILVLRESPNSKIYQGQILDFLKNKENNQLKEQIEQIQKKIDSCIILENMSTYDKKQRIKQMNPILKIFYQTIENFQSQLHKFTKQNFIEKFLIEDEINQYQTKTVLDVIKYSNNFVESVKQIKEDIYQKDALPILNVKNQIRSQVLEIRNKVSLRGQEQEILEEEMSQNLEKLFDNLKQIGPTNILKEFHQIIQDKNGYCSLILYEISKKLREITAQQLINPTKQKDELLKSQKDQLSRIQSFNNEEKEARLQEQKNELQKIQNDIYKKSISLEHFWRCLIFYLGKETDCKDFIDQFGKQQISKSIDGLLKNGDCFELIDGENLEFKGQFIQEVIDSSKKDKVIVVCVIGPQSSGKSTLMNFAFGTQFFTSTGRCTKGIYFTLQKFPYDNKANVKWLLMLDTEGLQSPEKIDDEYDRKIVLFAMLSANVLIINNKGEINSQMINTLKMCCLTFDMLKKFGYSPQIMYTYGQNDQKDQRPFIEQVMNIKNDVIQASNSPTIEKTAEEVLGFNDEKINVFGFAYNTQVFEKDFSKGLKQDINFKIGITNFGVQTSIIFKKLCEIVNNNSLQFNEISKWLEDSRQNWILIDKYSGDINAFKNLDEYQNDKKVQKIMFQLWNEYITKYDPIENDKIKASEETMRLIEIFKISSKQILESEILKVEFANNKEKDEQLKEYIIDLFDNWRKLPAQKQVTSNSVDKYKNGIQAKMDVIKNEFKMNLGAKIKEEQIKWMYKIGIKRFIDRAIEIQKDNSFNQKSTQEQEEYLQIEFQICWDAQIEEMQNQAKIKEMKQTYFNDLLKTFKSEQKFIKNVSTTEFNLLIERISPYLNNQQEQGQIQQQQQKCLLDFIVSELKNQDLRENKMFGTSNQTFLQIVNDPNTRIFDKNKPEEKFLKLKELINCDYVYKVITNLNTLDRKFLQNDILKNLSVKKEQSKSKMYKNQWGDIVQQPYKQLVDDQNHQISYLSKLFMNLTYAGFQLNQNSKILLFFTYSQKKSLMDIDASKLYQEEFSLDKYKDKDKEQHQQLLKKEWAKNFTKDLEFSEKDFKYMDNSIKKFFAQDKVIIPNRQSPFESLQDHINLQRIQDPQNNKLDFLIEPILEFEYVRSEKAKQQNLGKKQFQTLINPKNNQSEMVQTEQYLIQIAMSQLDWQQIAKTICENVYQVLNNNQIDVQQDINSEKIMEINQMTSQQVSKLENEYLSKLRNTIDNELLSKLGIFISKQMESQISWCALIICWVEYFIKAEKTFNQQLSNFLKQYDKEFEQFKLISQGNNNSVTDKSIQSLIQTGFTNFENKLKIKYHKLILNDLQQNENDFDSFKIYQELDEFYLAFGKQYEINALYKYVEDPIQIFRDKVKELKQIKIDNQIISQYDNQIRLKFIENLQAFLKLIQELQYQLISEQNNWGIVENYFKIVDDQNKELDFHEKKDIINQISPVIYHVLIKILEGEFNMNQIEFNSKDDQGSELKQSYLTIKNQQGTESNYYFTPQKQKQNGPLEIFTDQQFLVKIKNLHQNLKNKDLITEVLNILKNQKYQKDPEKIYQLDIIIDSTIKYIQNQIEQIKNKAFDIQYFDCEQRVTKLCDKAIGCTTQCKFCRRKCELGPHNTAEQSHHCDNVGHQLRVFAGGHFANSFTGYNYPSLGSCDTIDKDQFMYIDGNRNTWIEIVNTQMSDWNIDFEQENMNSKKTHILFQDFWKQIGPQYCKDKNMQYIEKQEEQDQLQQNKLVDPEVVIFALDESGSMRGDKWENGVIGANKYIEFLNENHLKPKTVQLIIIFFNDTARVVYNDILQYPLPDIWKMRGGNTSFEDPIKLAFQEIQQHIDTKKMARFNFFTDGVANYPKDTLNQVNSIFQENKDKYFIDGKLKLKILLMCEDEQNPVMDLMRNKFNEISVTHFQNDEVCQLEKEVQTEEIGKIMIESFNFNI